MARIGVFYGSCGGCTQRAALEIAKTFNVEEDDIINMEEDFDDIEQFLEYDVLFLGSSTWGQGDVQRDWVDPLLEVEEEGLDFSGKKIALFGAGDAKSHGEHFVSALGKMYELFHKQGAQMIGSFPTNGYSYSFSLAEKEGNFCGLALDDINEPQKSSSRIQMWTKLVQQAI